ncbi:hypothetical protein TNCV_2234761 [Trichonephila clavipes]|nr:hypothetical protein TNCV_2234761 [Trichonephila clavipes]
MSGPVFGNIIVDLELIVEAFAQLCCPKCFAEKVELFEDSRYGLCSPFTLKFYDHFQGLGLSSKLDVWIPHVLTEINLSRRIDVCDSLLIRHDDPFLKHIITGDENGHGARKMNQLKPFPKPIFTKKGDDVYFVGF